MLEAHEHVFLIKLVNENHISKMAEVGVLEGYMIEHILGSCNCVTEYYAIDPWEVYRTASPGRIPTIKDQEWWDGLYNNIVDTWGKDSRVHIMRKTSLEAAKEFPEQFFDFVYIDANHSYPSTLKDIIAWAPLVQIDGILAGHDYLRFGEVKQAVDEILAGCKYAVEPSHLELGIWWLKMTEDNRKIILDRCTD